MVLATVLATCAVILSLVAVYYAVDSKRVALLCVPKKIIDGQNDLGERVRAVEAESAAVRVSMVSWVAEMTGLMESVEGCLGQIETKRRKTSAAAARMDRENGGQEADPATFTRAQLTQLARDRGVY